MNSRYVSLADLSRYVVIRWYRIIICAVIFALLIGSKQYKASKIIADTAQAEADSYAALDESGREDYYMKHIGLDDVQKSQVTNLMSNEGKIDHFNVILSGKLNDTQISDYKRQIADIENAMTSIKVSMNQKQWDYYYYLKDGTVPEFKFEIPEIVINKKKIVEAGAVGAILYIMLIIVRYLLNGKLRFTDEVKAFYGVEELGKITFVKRKLARIARPKISLKEQMLLSAFDVDFVAKKNNVKSVTCIGCRIEDKKIQEVYQVINDRLSQSNISSELMTGDFTDANQLEKLASSEQLVLIELCGKSSDKKIKEELDKAKRYNLNVAGMVVVE